MDKKLKKDLESKLVITMQDILSRINPSASASAKKKIREAGKMVAKKFAKSIADSSNKDLKVSASKKNDKKKNAPLNFITVRDSNGRFKRKKK